MKDCISGLTNKYVNINIMAEKTTKKVSEKKATPAKKVSTTKKVDAPKAEKKVAEKKAPATKKVATPTVYINAENVGFKAGDVYQTLAKAEKALTVADIAKLAGITTEEVYLGIGWLFKEGKIVGDDKNITLA